MLDSAVNIAFPAISSALHVSATAVQWVVIAYMLPFAGGLLLAGHLADRRGHGRVFTAGLLASGAAYLLCGAAPALGWLVAARVLQGLGAALVFGSAPALVTLATPEPRRGRALAGFSLSVSLGLVLGPLLGGFLVEVWGWRVVYLGRIPLVVAALFLARRACPESLRACEEIAAGSAPVGGSGGGAVVAPPQGELSARGPASVIPPALRGHRVADRRTFVAANAVNLLANVALFSVWLLVPYYLLDRRGLAAGPGGILFAGGALATVAATPVGGFLADRGAARWLAPLALGAEALGLWLTSRLGAESSWTEIALALALGGAGAGLFVVPNMHYVMGALPRARQGLAGSLVTLMRTGGIVVGARLTALVYDARVATYAAADIPPRVAAPLAFTDTFRLAAALAAGAALLSLVPPRRGMA